MIAVLALAGALSVADPALTPGVVRPLTVEQICATRWGRDERAVTAAMKRETFRRYGLTGRTDPRCSPQRCEVDHRIGREIGGADVLENLAPQPYGGPWNAHDKDRLENRLHVLVCAGSMTLPAAQDALRSDWTGAYVLVFGAVPKSAR